MSKKEQARRSARDRRPTEVPHHPRMLTIAWIVAAVACVIMGLWFWAMLTGQGLIVTAEQNTAAANAELAAEEEAEAEAVEEVEEAEESESAPVVITPESIDIEPPEEPEPEPETSEPETSEPESSGAEPKAPKAPEATDTVTDEWDLTAWSVLSDDGGLVVSGNLANVSGQSLSGEIRVHVYSEGEHVATTTLYVVDFPDEGAERVELTSEAEWVPGSKVLVLEFVPDSNR